MRFPRLQPILRLGASVLTLAFVFIETAPLSAKPKEKKHAETSTRTLSQLVLGGQFSQALQFLEGLSDKKAKGPWQLRLKFMAAYLNLKAKNYAKAVDLFEEVRKDYAPLRDYVDYYLAVALRESGKTQESIRLFSELSARVLPPRLSQGVARELSLAYCKAGDRGTAIDRLNALIQHETSAARTYRLRFDRAQCLLDLGDKAEAFALLKSLYLNFPEGDLNGEILAGLQKAEPAYRMPSIEARPVWMFTTFTCASSPPRSGSQFVPLQTTTRSSVHQHSCVINSPGKLLGKSGQGSFSDRSASHILASNASCPRSRSPNSPIRWLLNMTRSG